MPSLNPPMVLELDRGEVVVARDNVIVLGDSGTGKTHCALALGHWTVYGGFCELAALPVPDHSMMWR